MAAMKPRTGDGPLEATKEGRGIVMRVPLEGGGRLVVELTPEEAAALGDELLELAPDALGRRRVVEGGGADLDRRGSRRDELEGEFADVLAWLKASGKGYQSRINAILREAMLRGR